MAVERVLQAAGVIVRLRGIRLPKSAEWPKSRMLRDASNLAVEVGQAGCPTEILHSSFCSGPWHCLGPSNLPGKSPSPFSIPDIPRERVVRTHVRTYICAARSYPVYRLVVKYLHCTSSPSFLRLNSLDDCRDLLGISHVDLTRQLAYRFASLTP